VQDFVARNHEILEAACELSAVIEKLNRAASDALAPLCGLSEFTPACRSLLLKDNKAACTAFFRFMSVTEGGRDAQAELCQRWNEISSKIAGKDAKSGGAKICDYQSKLSECELHRQRIIPLFV
jgi:hypothetical protein